MTAQDTNAPQTGKNSPVNRARRSYFIFFVVGFCLFVSAILTGLAAWGTITLQIALVTTLVESLVGLAGIATVAYVGGSSIDYNGGIGNMFRRNGTVDPYAPPQPVSYNNYNAHTDTRQGNLFRPESAQSMG